MSRLDRHIAMVQNKLAVQRLLQGLVVAALVFLVALWIGVIIDRVFQWRPPQHVWWLWGGVGAGALGAILYAVIRRPGRHEAAVFIDERLALKEKFSTALFARPLADDPFAQAAVKDAERTGENVSLHKRFPLSWPRRSAATAVVALLVGATMMFLPRMELFGKPSEQASSTTPDKQIEQIRKDAEKALQVVVAAQARGMADEEIITQAKRDLEQLINAPIRDPEKARRSAARALADVDQAVKSQMANNQRVADAESSAKAFKSLTPPSDEKGPVADAQRQIAKAQFSEAIDELSKAVDNFDKMTEQDQKKAAEQMQTMAKQLEQMANDPKQRDEMEKQLQQLGMDQKQAQQVAQQMQQAAQGDKQAQQQLAQQAQQMMQQMNNGQGPTPQQQQQMQQMMQQMQAQANTQAQAQQMAQAAQQMAQAMQQAAQQQQGGQQGQQQGGQQGNQQQMAQAMQQMQQQLGAMQAMKADAQQMQAMQNAMNQAAQQAANGLNQGGQAGQQGQQAQGQWQGQNGGQWQQGDNRDFKGPNDGMGGGGIGAGDRSEKAQAPYALKEEMSPSQDIEEGKILASTLIKAQSIKGESKVTAQSVAPPPEQEATDEIEQERISRPAQQAVKEYFSAWESETK